MRRETFKNWPEGWAIAFAAYAHGGEIYGKVRLQKYLAILQREGLPVPNRFVNRDMGPHDWAVDEEVGRLEQEGLIVVTDKPSGKPLNRVEYRLTPAGRKCVRHDIMPLIQGLPFGASLRPTIGRGSHFFRIKTDRVVDNLHKDLYLDNEEEFVEHLDAALDSLDRVASEGERRMSTDCEFCLDLLGSVDFARDCLREVKHAHIDDRRTGKHNLLYNAEKLIDAASSGLTHDHLPILDDSSPSHLKTLAETLKHRLHCMEINADLYGILVPIDPSTYEFPEFVVAK